MVDGILPEVAGMPTKPLFARRNRGCVTSFWGKPFIGRSLVGRAQMLFFPIVSDSVMIFRHLLLTVD